jgi:hypothetical protein
VLCRNDTRGEKRATQHKEKTDSTILKRQKQHPNFNILNQKFDLTLIKTSPPRCSHYNHPQQNMTTHPQHIILSESYLRCIWSLIGSYMEEGGEKRAHREKTIKPKNISNKATGKANFTLFFNFNRLRWTRSHTRHAQNAILFSHRH